MARGNRSSQTATYSYQLRIFIGDFLTGEVRPTLEDEHAIDRKEVVTWKPFSIRHRTSTFRQLLRRWCLSTGRRDMRHNNLAKSTTSIQVRVRSEHRTELLLLYPIVWSDCSG